MMVGGGGLLTAAGFKCSKRAPIAERARMKDTWIMWTASYDDLPSYNLWLMTYVNPEESDGSMGHHKVSTRQTRRRRTGKVAENYSFFDSRTGFTTKVVVGWYRPIQAIGQQQSLRLVATTTCLAMDRSIYALLTGNWLFVPLLISVVLFSDFTPYFCKSFSL
jgi:hypothetical protein